MQKCWFISWRFDILSAQKKVPGPVVIPFIASMRTTLSIGVLVYGKSYISHCGARTLSRVTCYDTSGEHKQA
jgi:hypothetical protein